MNSSATPAQLLARYRIDCIAKDLPEKFRADFYREMLYCESLPENDELLRILRIMQILTVIMQKVPERVAIERDNFELLFKNTLESLGKTLRSSEAYQKQLDLRLNHLPAALAKDINPDAIAAKVNEGLHQQFARSTIPETAWALAAIADEMKKTTTEFSQTAGSLDNEYRGAAADARRAIQEMQSTISSTSETARLAANQLSSVFRQQFLWALSVLTGVALILGLFLGMTYQSWLDSPVRVDKQIGAQAPAVQSEQEAKRKN